MKLVVIEAPAKRETLKKYLGTGYEVFATKGHIRDLPAKKFGVDMKNFNPNYEIMPDKKELMEELKRKATKADEVLVATDPDREGEAISWHVAHIIGLNPESKCRIEFNEISEKAVKKALTQARPINLKLVDAQQARRVLDRIVGYKLSPIICKKIKPRLSAGRVQSVALKLVVDREKEIEEFKPQEYWNVTANLLKKSSKFKAMLSKYKKDKIEPKTKEEIDKILSGLENAKYIVESVKASQARSKAPAPFTTSTMQSDAGNKLGMTLKRSSFAAQQLYEGVEIAGEGKTALITYIRTDSTRVSPDAQASALEYIKDKYGAKYAPARPNFYASKKSAQDAHEAIRPITLARTPESVKASLAPDNYKLYKLVYERFLASQMTEAEYDNVAAVIDANEYKFKANGKTMTFAGYTAAYKEFEEDDEKQEITHLPELKEGEEVKLESLLPEQKFTKPPARYTEASLVKAMEELGIGRPATYAPTITTLANRWYTEKDGRALKPTELGRKVTDYVDQFFSQVINVKFTAHMEERLDDIEEKDEEWKNVIESFWAGFKGLLEKADASSVTMRVPPKETDIVCDKCGKKMLEREGRFGKFLGCSGYPECKNIVQMRSEINVVGICPDCGKNVVSRKSKKGKTYFSCSGYPECKFISWDIPTGEKCPECSAYLVKKKNGIKCSACKYFKEVAEDNEA